MIEAEPLADLDYAVVTAPDHLAGGSRGRGGAIALVAATFGAVRLIDNRVLGV